MLEGQPTGHGRGTVGDRVPTVRVLFVAMRAIFEAERVLEDMRRRWLRQSPYDQVLDDALVRALDDLVLQDGTSAHCLLTLQRAGFAVEAAAVRAEGRGRGRDARRLRAVSDALYGVRARLRRLRREPALA